MKKQANQSQNKSFKPTPIPLRTKFGEPMAYYTLSDDGKTHTEVSRFVCLARTEEPENPFQQRCYVDEESGLVVRLPCNQIGEDLARDNMRSIWREQKYQERKFQCVWKGTSKCDQKCETCKSRTSRTVELDKPLGNDSDGSDTFYEPSDPTDITEILEQKAVLDTLHAALATLTQGDLELIKDRVILEQTVRELAPKYGFKSSRSITVHVRRILDILRNDEALKKFFE
ncbi:sigma-70 RNA polymerase sigma factor region 4 domain-containing protein [Syntrophomonas wolfei]|uniref:sigma-70 family RNA polymerase sigma factor n=1 Tax=Syntrophomonas wolfei TaxID=863 RepID=UPI000774B62C|nr:sigma-70 family RNA polymerase sigma factor [Syntrophomonas wolfei]